MRKSSGAADFISSGPVNRQYSISALDKDRPPGDRFCEYEYVELSFQGSLTSEDGIRPAGNFMSDFALIVLAVIGVFIAGGVPLLAYSMMPRKAMELASQHGRFSGLGAPEPAGSSAGNTPAPSIGSLQGQTA